MFPYYTRLEIARDKHSNLWTFVNYRLKFYNVLVDYRCFTISPGSVLIFILWHIVPSSRKDDYFYESGGRASPRRPPPPYKRSNRGRFIIENNELQKTKLKAAFTLRQKSRQVGVFSKCKIFLSVLQNALAQRDFGRSVNQPLLSDQGILIEGKTQHN